MLELKLKRKPRTKANRLSFPLDYRSNNLPSLVTAAIPTKTSAEVKNNAANHKPFWLLDN